MSKNLVMLGSGGHAKVLFSLLQRKGLKLWGVISSNRLLDKNCFYGFNQISSDDEFIKKFSPEEFTLVNGIGSLPGLDARWLVAKKYHDAGFRFKTCIDNTSFVDNSVKLEEGVQILAGAIVQPGVSIGSQTIINTTASIDHDCKIGSNVHIAPGAVLSGEVVIEPMAHIGPGSIVSNGLLIKYGAIIGAGSSILRNVKKKQKIIPAKLRSF